MTAAAIAVSESGADWRMLDGDEREMVLGRWKMRERTMTGRDGGGGGGREVRFWEEERT
jgi:hypothetical protein